jgi:very-short-patch-repair endonuclease
VAVDSALHRLADSQLGLVCIDQLDDLGLAPTDVFRRTERGRLEWLSPRVLRVVGSQRTSWQRALAATMDAGDDAAVSHRSAAAFYRIPGFRIDPVHVTRQRQGNKRPSNLAVIHEPRLLLPEHIVQRGPVRLTTPARTLFDLAAMVHVDRLARNVDAMIVRRYTSPPALHAMLRVLARRGRPGIRNMREVLAERPIGYKPPESALEARVAQALVNGGLDAPERQVDLGDDDGWVARVDLYYRPLQLIIFVDGDFWHSMLSDRAGDARQQARLERAGFHVERVDEKTVYLDPHSIVRLVRQVQRRRAAA